MAGILQRLRFTMQCPSTPRRMAARWCCRPSSLPLALALTAAASGARSIWLSYLAARQHCRSLTRGGALWDGCGRLWITCKSVVSSNPVSLAVSILRPGAKLCNGRHLIPY